MAHRPEDFQDFEELSSFRQKEQQRFSPSELLKNLTPEDRQRVDELAQKRGISSEEELLRLIRITLMQESLGIELVPEDQIKPEDRDKFTGYVSEDQPLLRDDTFDEPELL